MKKLKLSIRFKRIAIQLALLIPIVIMTGVDLLYPSILILSVLSFHGIVTLYGNDPFFKDCASESMGLEHKPYERIRDPLDPYNIFLGYSTPGGREWAMGY